MSFIDKTVTVFIVMCVLGEVWCGIELGDVCGCDCVSSLDVFVNVVDTYNQDVIVSFHSISYVKICFCNRL